LFIVRRGVWDADMPGALVADEMGLGKIFTSVAAVMIRTLQTEKVVMGLPLLIFWGNTLAVWVNMLQNDFPGIVSERQEWYPLQRLNSVPHHLLEILTTPSHGHPALVSTHETIVVVTIPAVAETYKTVIHVMTHETNFKHVNLLYTENANLTQKDLNTSIEEPQNRWNIHLLSYDRLISSVKPSSNGRLSHCVW
jgi:hypothetical protein